jgi:hypothetical protein
MGVGGLTTGGMAGMQSAGGRQTTAGGTTTGGMAGMQSAGGRQAGGGTTGGMAGRQFAGGRQAPVDGAVTLTAAATELTDNTTRAARAKPDNRIAVLFMMISSLVRRWNYRLTRRYGLKARLGPRHSGMLPPCLANRLLSAAPVEKVGDFLDFIRPLRSRAYYHPELCRPHRCM